MNLPNGFEWCRKSKYEVQIELACYPLGESSPLLEGFEEGEFEIDGEKRKYAFKRGYNKLEKNNWTTNPGRPYVVTGTQGERWPIKPSNLTAYDINPSEIGVIPITVSTKDPSSQEFLVCIHIEEGTNEKVYPSWAFGSEGIDETQAMTSNAEDSAIPHNGGDYIVAKHIEGQPEYMQLPPEVRNTPEIAKLYDPRVINGSIMQTTYDHAITKEEIIEKYETNGMKL